MSKTEYVYTTYIQSTPEKVFAALTTKEFLKQYWEGMDSDWKKGSKWAHHNKNGRTIGGTVLESDPPKRLVYSWADLADAKDVADPSRVTFEIADLGGTVKLSVIHGNLGLGSPMAQGISKGWPRVLSSLKSLLETGKALDMSLMKSEECGS